jgi:hypothetical protein
MALRKQTLNYPAASQLALDETSALSLPRTARTCINVTPAR